MAQEERIFLWRQSRSALLFASQKGGGEVQLVEGELGKMWVLGGKEKIL